MRPSPGPTTLSNWASACRALRAKLGRLISLLLCSLLPLIPHCSFPDLA